MVQVHGSVLGLVLGVGSLVRFFGSVFWFGSMGSVLGSVRFGSGIKPRTEPNTSVLNFLEPEPTHGEKKPNQPNPRRSVWFGSSGCRFFCTPLVYAIQNLRGILLKNFKVGGGHGPPRKWLASSLIPPIKGRCEFIIRGSYLLNLLVIISLIIGS